MYTCVWLGVWASEQVCVGVCKCVCVFRGVGLDHYHWAVRGENNSEVDDFSRTEICFDFSPKIELRENFGWFNDDDDDNDDDDNDDNYDDDVTIFIFSLIFEQLSFNHSEISLKFENKTKQEF